MEETLDRRCKIKMCAYGSCRKEFYGKGYNYAGMKLYCLKHRPLVRKGNMTRYRKGIPEKISKRNKEYRDNNKEYMSEYKKQWYIRKNLEIQDG
jgi:hypothetical protein